MMMFQAKVASTCWKADSLGSLTMAQVLLGIITLISALQRWIFTATGP